MWKADCENCDRDVWTLQKNPENYQRGVTCPDCGSTRVEVWQEGGQQTTAEREPEQERAEPREAEVVARRDENPSGQPPARQDGSAGTNLADALALSVDGEASNADRVTGIASLAGVGLEMMDRLSEHAEAKERAQREKAKNVDLQPVEDLPTCPECEYQFGPDELRGQTTECPDCHRTLRIVE